MTPLVRALRPKQWPKNLLVFAAPAAAAAIDEPRVLARALGAFVAFCAVSSATYLVNDARDIESDRLHPTKRNRPIAAGLVSLRTAYLLAAGLFVAGLALAAVTGRWPLVLTIAVYVAVTAAYSFGLKRIAVVDLLAVAAGFILRAVAGAAAVDVPLSNWFLIAVSFGSLFVVTGKRYAELGELKREGLDAGAIRASLDQYTPDFLRIVLGSALTGTLLAYCLWAFEKEDAAVFRFPLYLVSVIPMATILLRYLLQLDRGLGAAPEELFWKDRTLQVLGVVWAALFAWAVYAG